MQSKFIVAAFAAFVSWGVMAEDQSPTWGDISRLQAQEILYKAQVGAAKARNEAQALGAGGSTSANQNSVSAPRPSEEIPTYWGSVGNPARPKATFGLSNGGQVTARVGDILQGDYKVAAIYLSKALLIDKSGRKIEVLRANGSAASKSTSQTPAVMPGQLPGSPVLMQ